MRLYTLSCNDFLICCFKCWGFSPDYKQFPCRDSACFLGAIEAFLASNHFVPALGTLNSLQAPSLTRAVCLWKKDTAWWELSSIYTFSAYIPSLNGDQRVDRSCKRVRSRLGMFREKYGAPLTGLVFADEVYFASLFMTLLCCIHIIEGEQHCNVVGMCSLDGRSKGAMNSIFFFFASSFLKMEEV